MRNQKHVAHALLRAAPRLFGAPGFRLALPILLFAAAAYAQTPCDQLKSLNIPEATFTTIETVAAGPYKAPAQNADGGGVAPGGAGRGAPAPAGRGGQPTLMLPAYCRVAATLKPSSDSDIKMEVWLPADNWNGKIQVVGNGGWAGVISYAAMAQAVKEGYASASTDTGHEGGNGMFALGHPEKIVDFGYRAVHDTVTTSKAVVAAYYGKGPKYSYWNGCSTGGRQALVEVTRYPDDFDGVVAGAPANPHIHLHASSTERAIEEMHDPEGALSQAQLEMLHKAVLDKCDALDGVKDGLVSDPHKCKFDPSVLLCKNGASDNCLTAPQVQLTKIVYGDIKTKKGEIVWTGYEPGGELQYAQLRNIPTQPGLGLDSIRILGYQNADWDWHNYDLDRDLALADEKAGFIDAHTYDLSAFKAHGGKLLLYHGWADQGIPPGNTINFYNGVLAKMGSKQDDWVRLFMVPGMMHCQGGDGPDQFNKMGVVERWRESGVAPKEIVASHVSGGTVDRTRPLCPYPQVAVYKGTGSNNDASNFVCKLP
ncbi:MAG TPA: tannase/feruloyl esterase family alpha/beta hydrolase [Bryobacteraceae bacterium]|jgi:feruloyl esterase|nr:tannase/feruloyl esterase family alpha/beta hydrolase [Bryobacteraceae bacterium]